MAYETLVALYVVIWTGRNCTFWKSDLILWGVSGTWKVPSSLSINGFCSYCLIFRAWQRVDGGSWNLTGLLPLSHHAAGWHLEAFIFFSYPLVSHTNDTKGWRVTLNGARIAGSWENHSSTWAQHTHRARGAPRVPIWWSSISTSFQGSIAEHSMARWRREMAEASIGYDGCHTSTWMLMFNIRLRCVDMRRSIPPVFPQR